MCILVWLCFFFQAEDGIFFFFKQKTAYEISAWLEFRRVLFRSDRPFVKSESSPHRPAFHQVWCIPNPEMGGDRRNRCGRRHNKSVGWLKKKKAVSGCPAHRKEIPCRPDSSRGTQKSHWFQGLHCSWWTKHDLPSPVLPPRSEVRRVGQECRFLWSPYP